MYGTIWHALAAVGVIYFAAHRDKLYDLADDIAGMTAEALHKISLKKRISNYLDSRRGGSA
jgi:hypothetical protein